MKIDLKKDFKHLFNPPAKEVIIVDVPEMNFIMIDGRGDPNTGQEFKDAVEALYGLSYTLKFMMKKGELGIDYGVAPLEGLWWTGDMREFSMENKGIWSWTLMVMQPGFVTKDMFERAFEQFKKKKNLPALPKARFERFHEGLSAQIMHIGPYSTEGPTIEKLHGFIKENGYSFQGKHHEIYLGDPRKAASEKIKTVLRQPVKQ
ncbi:MAG: GyrI-like domain-containing protein [Eubacteriales bacterium]